MKSDFLYSCSVLSRTFRDYKWKIILLCVLGLLSSMLAGVGVGAIIPLLSFFMADDATQSAEGTISQAVIKYFEYLPFHLTPVLMMIIIVAMFFLRAVVLFLLNAIGVQIRTEYTGRTKAKVLSHLLNSSWAFFTKQKLGHISATLMQEIGTTGKLLDDIVNILLSVTNVIVFSLLAFAVSPMITSFALLFGGMVFILFHKLWAKGKEIGRGMMFLGKETTQFIVEHISGAKTVKSFAVEDFVRERGIGYFKETEALSFKNGLLTALYSVSTEPLSILFIAGVFLSSFFSSNFNLGVFAATLILVQRIFVYLGSAQLSIHVVNEKIANAIHLLEFEKLIADYREESGGKMPFSFRDKFSFEEVAFSYSSESPLFSGLTFDINKGEMIGIIGPSGSGKTTAADLFMRLLEPTAGRLTLDGKAAQEFDLKSWRENIGYVAQDPFLLNDTVGVNIKFYKKDLDDEAVASAAKKAHVYDFIQALPEKFNTVAGDRGVMLSGGQRQRITLARVLARTPQILILDEATSALDNESESLIRRVIKELKGKVTIIVIAHRLSTVADLDRILVLDGGRITEEGKPEALLKNPNSYFYRMHYLSSQQ